MTDTANDTTERVRQGIGDAVADAHGHSIRHRAEIEASDRCGCFYCRRIFGREKIKEWVDDDDTALCPHCGIDSVLGSASGYKILVPFLCQMHAAWFSAT
jgi:hypothetical protein